MKKVYGSIFMLFLLIGLIGVLNNRKVLSKEVSNIRGDGLSKVYITGDIHGLLGIERVLNINFLDEDDYLIILGDFGLLWEGSDKEKRALEKLNKKEFTTLFIDGNHENFDMLNSFPIESWNGGKIHKIKDKVFHLMRGEVFLINDKKYFTFGGGTSIDKENRKEHVDWWKEEMPSEEEIENGRKNLQSHNYNVDYMLTHTTDVDNLSFIGEEMSFSPEEDKCNIFLSEIKKKLTYDKWYFGHFHVDGNINNKDRVVFKDIIEIGQ